MKHDQAYILLYGWGRGCKWCAQGYNRFVGADSATGDAQVMHFITGQGFICTAKPSLVERLKKWWATR